MTSHYHQNGAQINLFLNLQNTSKKLEVQKVVEFCQILQTQNIFMFP